MLEDRRESGTLKTQGSADGYGTRWWLYSECLCRRAGSGVRGSDKSHKSYHIDSPTGVQLEVEPFSNAGGWVDHSVRAWHHTPSEKFPTHPPGYRQAQQCESSFYVYGLKGEVEDLVF